MKLSQYADVVILGHSVWDTVVEEESSEDVQPTSIYKTKYYDQINNIMINQKIMIRIL